MPSNKKLNTNKTKQISSEDTNGTGQDVDSHRKRASTSGRILHISIYLYSESSAAEQGILCRNRWSLLIMMIRRIFKARHDSEDDESNFRWIRIFPVASVVALIQ